MRVSEQLDLGYLLGRIQNGLLPTVGLSVLITAIWAIFGWSWFDITVVPVLLIALATLAISCAHLSVSYVRFVAAQKEWATFIGAVYAMGDAAVAQWAVKGRSKKPKAARDQFVSRLAAVPHVVRAELRGVQALDDITRLLDSETLDTLRGARAPERTLVGFSRVAIEHALESEQLTAEQYAMLHEQCTELTRSMSRLTLQNTTFAPPVLTALAPMITTTFCLLLPIGLVTTLGWLTPLLVPLVAAAFLLLNAIATSFSIPFGSHPDCLPLYRDCREIEVALLILIGQDSLPRNLEPFGGVVR